MITKQPNLLEKLILIILGLIAVILFFAVLDIVILTVAYLLNELFILLN